MFVPERMGTWMSAAALVRVQRGALCIDARTVLDDELAPLLAALGSR